MGEQAQNTLIGREKRGFFEGSKSGGGGRGEGGGGEGVEEGPASTASVGSCSKGSGVWREGLGWGGRNGKETGGLLVPDASRQEAEANLQHLEPGHAAMWGDVGSL